MAGFRASIDRINAAVRRHLGAAPVWRAGAADPILEAARLDLDVPLPADLEAFYRVSDGVEAFASWIAPVLGVGRLTRRVRDFMADYENCPDATPPLWGRPPRGSYLVISGTPTVMVDATGPPSAP